MITNPVLLRLWGVSPGDLHILQISLTAVAGKLNRRLLAIFGVLLVFFVLHIVVFTAFPPLYWVVGGIAIVPITTTLYAKKIILEARRRRTDMNMAVAVFLDLVNVLLAGGAGIETAIVTAASVGDGWAFQEIRNTITRAQSSREQYWDALHEVGEVLSVQALQDVAQSIRLAGEHGGRIRQSLMSRADALRKNNLASVEYQAEQQTERMGIPMVVMFVGFVMFIGYPAFVSTLTAL